MRLTNIKLTLALLVLACYAGPSAFGQKEPLFFEHNAEIIHAQYDEDDNLIITTAANGIVNLWDPETGRLIRTFGVVARQSPWFLTDFSPDGKLIAAVNGRAGKIWNTKFGDIVCSLSGYSDTITAIHFSANNRWLVAASQDGTAKLWDPHSGKRSHSLNHQLESLGKKDQQHGVTDVRFCDQDQLVVTGSGLPVWDSVTVRLDSTHTGRRFMEHYDSAILVWDVKSGKVNHIVKGYPFDISPDGAHLVSGSVNTADRSARVWDILAGKLLFTLTGHKGEVTACRFSQNGKWILTASADDLTCRLWDVASGKEQRHWETGPLSRHGDAIQFSPDSRWVSTFARDSIKLWEAGTSRLVRTVAADHPVVFSNDSRHLVVLSGTRASVYETVSGKPVMVEKKPVGKGAKKVLRVD
jgi:WD40 repeat protein